ncbi:hypothetical protein [Pseudomonas syringae group genomosp. 3]|uniref:hypothetical protein n=1 Tax=Pseudomonas syringae group genomosp. 3 TaxID=251701 RepID=UPI0011EA60F8|nr:hypothetical protein [Pseudomonas syringae group genomosp. 3]
MSQNATPQIANYQTIAIRLIRDPIAINHKAFQQTPIQIPETNKPKPETQKPRNPETQNTKTQALALIGNILIKGDKATSRPHEEIPEEHLGNIRLKQLTPTHLS